MSEKTRATVLVELAEQQFRFGCDLDGRPFAVELRGPNVALPMRGTGGLRSVLAQTYYAAYGQAPGQNPLSEALLVIEGLAMLKHREPVALRMGRHGDSLVIDLARPDGRAVVIGPSGWSVAERSPILFRKSEVIGELPIPVSGGTFAGLRGLLNVTDADWPVLVACLVAALFPDLAHPIVAFNGEQGTSKTTASRMFIRIFDGADADVQAVPRNIGDWAVVASASWSVGLDNVSKIDPWLSDALCRASTGARTLKRALYSDDGVSVLRIRRVVVLNGIDPVISGGDLAERLVRFDLEPITERVTDEELSTCFDALHAKALGALCDLAGRVLARLPGVVVPNPPRMVSFARVLAVVDAELGTDGITRYREMVADQLAATAEASTLGQVLERMITEDWEGPAGELLTFLRTDGHLGRDDLPKTPRGLTSELKRSAPGLRARGWRVNRGRGHERFWRLVPPPRGEQGRQTAAMGASGASSWPDRVGSNGCVGSGLEFPSTPPHGERGLHAMAEAQRPVGQPLDEAERWHNGDDRDEGDGEP
jgi:hypothetical protein